MNRSQSLPRIRDEETFLGKEERRNLLLEKRGIYRRSIEHDPARQTRRWASSGEEKNISLDERNREHLFPGERTPLIKGGGEIEHSLRKRRGSSKRTIEGGVSASVLRLLYELSP